MTAWQFPKEMCISDLLFFLWMRSVWDTTLLNVHFQACMFAQNNSSWHFEWCKIRAVLLPFLRHFGFLLYSHVHKTSINYFLNWVLVIVNKSKQHPKKWQYLFNSCKKCYNISFCIFIPVNQGISSNLPRKKDPK